MKNKFDMGARRAIFLIACAIFFSEFCVMLALSIVSPLPIYYEAFIDAFLLICILSPLLYLFLFLPFKRQITIKESAEEALRLERDLAQSYLDVAGVMLVVIDSAWRVTLINKRGREILGYREENIIGKSWFDTFFSGEEAKRGKALFMRLFAGDVAPRKYSENLIITSSGERRLMGWHNSLLKDEHGAVTAILSSGEDITDQRRAEEALKRSREELEERVAERTARLTEINEQLEKEFAEHTKSENALRESELRFRSVTESAGDAIIAIDKNGVIVSWNNGAARLFGYTESEAIGLPLTRVMPERYREAHLNGVTRVNMTGKSGVLGRTLEFEGLRKDGSEFPVELSIGMWKTSKGLFYSGILRDVTYRKRVEEEKDSIQSQLLHSQKLEATGRLVVGVSHDFSNIILSIKGYSYTTMKALPEESPLHKNMEKILSLVERGSNITKQLVLFGRKQERELTVIDMNILVEGLLKMINNLIRADISVTVEITPGLWPIMADKGNMDQVLMNLVVNASEAMPGGGRLSIRTANVRLDEEEAAVIAEAGPGDFISLIVTDTGVGMDKTVTDRIFDPFFTTKGKEGSGLGLSVVYGIVSQHHGWMTVDSEPGVGSTFRVFLPASPELLEEKEEAET